MKILFLDDSNHRTTTFISNWIGNEIDTVCTADGAITLLEMNSYDMIFLDHDLEEDHYTETKIDDKNGLFVAKKLKNLVHLHGKTVVLHSLNANGRENMESVLKDKFKVIKLPFAWQFDHKTFVENYK